MPPLSTEDFPYTAGYVKELLNLDEGELQRYVSALGLAPNREEMSSPGGGDPENPAETPRTRMIFTHRDVELLKRAVELRKQGEELSAIAGRLGEKTENGGFSAAPVKPSAPAQSLATSTGGRSMDRGRDNVSVLVETVSQVKEGILKDLGRLLDDKLSGLDEVVVELIRCKSENDRLAKELDNARQRQQELEREVASFKPVQFGFYRKEHR